MIKRFFLVIAAVMVMVMGMNSFAYAETSPIMWNSSSSSSGSNPVSVYVSSYYPKAGTENLVLQANTSYGSVLIRGNKGVLVPKATRVDTLTVADPNTEMVEVLGNVKNLQITDNIKDLTCVCSGTNPYAWEITGNNAGGGIILTVRAASNTVWGGSTAADILVGGVASDTLAGGTAGLILGIHSEEEQLLMNKGLLMGDTPYTSTVVNRTDTENILALVSDEELENLKKRTAGRADNGSVPGSSQMDTVSGNAADSTAKVGSIQALSRAATDWALAQADPGYAAKLRRDNQSTESVDASNSTVVEAQSSQNIVTGNVVSVPVEKDGEYAQ